MTKRFSISPCKGYVIPYYLFHQESSEPFVFLPVIMKATILHSLFLQRLHYLSWAAEKVRLVPTVNRFSIETLL